MVQSLASLEIFRKTAFLTLPFFQVYIIVNLVSCFRDPILI